MSVSHHFENKEDGYRCSGNTLAFDISFLVLSKIAILRWSHKKRCYSKNIRCTLFLFDSDVFLTYVSSGNLIRIVVLFGST